MLCHDAFRLRATRIVPVMRIGAGSFGGVGRCAAPPGLAASAGWCGSGARVSSEGDYLACPPAVTAWRELDGFGESGTMGELVGCRAAQGPVSPGGDHAGFRARGCPRSHPPCRTAGHARGNRTSGQRHRACRAMDSPHDNLLQHGHTAHGAHRRCAGARGPAMRDNGQGRQPGYPVGA